MPDSADLSLIPSMTVLLKAAANADGLRGLPASVIADGLRAAVDDLRRELLQGRTSAADSSVDALLSRARAVVASRRTHRLTRVINATGVVLHTGLGRSVLADAAVERIRRVAAGYCSLEIELDSGKRGKRGKYAEELLCRLTGAEAALIVNNNAAATMLALGGLARGREVIVSRGQLIEIGGSYRLPEVMTAGGAVLREVGTTNKTHLRDYEAAINEHTALLMHVHTSNYRVVGFAESPGVAELTDLAHRRGLLMFDDLGSGALLDDEMWRSADEPTVVASLRSGADLLTFSGDKLLGGPQAGILLGKREIIDELRRDPMARALRIDKLVIAALEATLELYQSPETVMQQIPLLAGLSTPLETLIARAETLAARLRAAVPDPNRPDAHRDKEAALPPDPNRPDAHRDKGAAPPPVPNRDHKGAAPPPDPNRDHKGAAPPPVPNRPDADRDKGAASAFTVQRDESFAGGGSLPAWPLPTAVVRWTPPGGVSLDDLTRRLRLGEPSVLARINEGAILFDLRTITEREFPELVSAVSSVHKP